MIRIAKAGTILTTYLRSRLKTRTLFHLTAACEVTQAVNLFFLVTLLPCSSRLVLIHVSQSQDFQAYGSYFFLRRHLIWWTRRDKDLYTTPKRQKTERTAGDVGAVNNGGQEENSVATPKNDEIGKYRNQ